MPKAKPNTAMDVPLSFPFGGIDNNAALTDASTQTTVEAINARPFDCISGKRRGSRRPAVAKYIPTPIVSGSPIQAINTLVVAQDETAGTGDVLTQGAAGNTVVDREAVAGTSQTITGTTTPNSTQTLGCSDENANEYVASITSTSIRITKIGSDLTVAWTINKTISNSGSPSIAGFAVFGGIIYLYLADSTTPGLFRFLTTDGTQKDQAAWLTSNEGLATVTGLTKAYQMIALGGGVMGLVGGKSGALILQQIVLATGVIAHETTLQGTFVSYPAKIVPDLGANFYVLTNASGSAVNKVIKVNGSGVILWTDVSGSSGARDISYEPTTYAVGVVGTAIFPTTSTPTAYFTSAAADDSYAYLNADTGTRVGGGKPNAQTTWLAIAADGLGSFRLRRSDAGGASDLLSMTVANVANWTVSTGFVAPAVTLWLACVGTNIVPVSVPMRSTRVIRTLCVAGGQLKKVEGTTVSTITSTFCSASAPVVFGAPIDRIIYYTDGQTYRLYNGRTDVAGTLTALAGSSLPADPNGGKCRGVEAWRTRLLWFGLLSDPHNCFASAMGDATDYAYLPTPSLPTEAFALATSDCGLCPDIINGIIPYTNELAIFLGDHTIHRMEGDPADGGTFVEVTDQTGGAFGRAWCKDPSGNIYFYGSRGSVWRMQVGGMPQKLSNAIEAQRLFDIDLNLHNITMCWDDTWQGLHIFITPQDRTQSAVHYWWDAASDAPTAYRPAPRQGSWWSDKFKNKNHNPMAVAILDGDDPGDKVLLMGGGDGYLRVWDENAKDDDGYVIEAEVTVGPLRNPGGRPFRLVDLQAIMAEDSGDLQYVLLSGESAESALNGTENDPGTLKAGRNRSQPISRRGHVQYVKLSSAAKATRWSMENALVKIMPITGDVAQRAW